MSATRRAIQPPTANLPIRVNQTPTVSPAVPVPFLWTMMIWPISSWTRQAHSSSCISGDDFELLIAVNYQFCVAMVPDKDVTFPGFAIFALLTEERYDKTVH